MKPKTKRGGKRKGAGRKPFLKQVSVKKGYLDQLSIKRAEYLGDGNFSAGVRKALTLAAENGYIPE